MTSTTYRSPLLDLPGAAPLQDTEALIDATGVAWHYGDPLGEQRRAHSGVVVVDRSHRRVVQVTGPDTEEFLNNLLSQKFLDTAEGFGASALDLDMQGRVLHHADVVRTAEGVLLDVPSAQLESFLSFLQKMVFWSQVEVTEAELAVLTLLGAAGDYEQGIQEANAVISGGVDDPRAWATVGFLEAKRGNIDTAATALSKAVELDPSDAYASYTLGLVKWIQTGDALPILPQLQRMNDYTPVDLRRRNWRSEPGFVAAPITASRELGSSAKPRPRISIGAACRPDPPPGRVGCGSTGGSRRARRSPSVQSSRRLPPPVGCASER